MPAVFHSRLDVAVRTRDGHNVTLLEPVEVVTETARYRAPEGTQSDGASTPAAVWSSLPPFGPYWLAAVVHDAAYRNTLERLQDGQWVPANLAREDCDRMFLDLMFALGVDDVTRRIIYEAVSEFGGKAFAEDRQA